MKVHIDLNTFSARRPVITIGVFDGVHMGHDKLLNRLKEIAKQENGESVVVTLWPHPRLVLSNDIKNLKLLNTLEEKKILLEKRKIDHLVIIPFNKETSRMTACEFTDEILAKKLNVHYLLVGHDHQFGKGREGDYNDLKACSSKYNFKLERLEAEKKEGIKISSTKIRNVLLEGKIQQANNYLGYEFFIKGKVVGGHRIGNRLGFPTANVEIQDSYKLIPKDGVYAVRAVIEGHYHNGMLNIGYRPTFNKYGSRKTIETHLFDFEDDIYNKDIIIHFVQRIREERGFENVDKLVEQLEKDKKAAKRIFTNLLNQ